jgi:hypothetical protein
LFLDVAIALAPTSPGFYNRQACVLPERSASTHIDAEVTVECTVAKYTVRIELPGASEEQYHHLDQSMEKRGFSRTIKATDGTWWRLPSGEYNVENETRNPIQLKELVVSIADAIRPGSWVLVTEAGSRAWQTAEVEPDARKRAGW